MERAVITVITVIVDIGLELDRVRPPDGRVDATDTDADATEPIQVGGLLRH